MNPLVLCSFFTLTLCCVYGYPQMMGMGMDRREQEQQSQQSEMGAGMGLNIGLGMTGGTFGRSTQMGSGGMNRMRLVRGVYDSNPGCYQRDRGRPSSTTTTTASVP